MVNVVCSALQVVKAYLVYCVTFTCDKQHARFELFETDDSFALESAAQQDEDSAWCDGGAQLVLVLAETLLLAVVQLPWPVFSGVVFGLR